MIQVQAPASAVIWCPLLVTGRGLNDRLHWAVRAKYTKKERGHIAWAFCEHRLRGGALPLGPYEVRLVRVFKTPAKLWDDDNWVGAAKALRDQVADELGVNDGDRAAIRFTYNQEKGARTGVRIEIHTRWAVEP